MSQPPTLSTRDALAQALSRLAVDDVVPQGRHSGAQRPARPTRPGPWQPPGGAQDRPTEPNTTRVDWGEVVELRRRASDEISTATAQWEVEARRRMPDADRRVLGRSVVRQVVRRRADELAGAGQTLWDAADEQAHVQAVMDAIFGFGRLQPLFELAEAENIEIHGWDSVVVQYGDGRRVAQAPVADSDEELVEAIRFLGETANPPRPFDDAHPMMTIAVGDRFRLHAIGFGLSYRPSLVIRQHILTEVGLDDLARTGMLPDHLADFLHRAVLARKSMVISGDQGAGKTTLLRALIDSIPDSERFGTLETDYELLTHLQPRRRNMLALQAKVGLGETHEGRHLGAWSVAQLIPEALRQNLSRLVVGEVRGEEAGAMFEAMQAGAGTLSTTHSHSAASTMDRLASRVAQGGVISIPEAYRQISHNIHLLIHVALVDDTWRGGGRRRYVQEVRALTGAMEGDRPTSHLVYQAATVGRPEVFHPEPAWLDELAQYAQFDDAQVDRSSTWGAPVDPPGQHHASWDDEHTRRGERRGPSA